MAKNTAKNKVKEEQKKAKKAMPVKSDKKKAKEPKVTKAPAKVVEKDNWDESDSSGGEYFKLKSGHHLGRIRSVISCGQVQFSFNKVLDDKATSALAFVIELWSYKIKKGEVKITCKEPAIVYHVAKALNGNPKATYTKTKKALGIKSPDQFRGLAVGVELMTSEKGYMYVRGAFSPLGLAEAKSTPKLTKKGMLVPNLDSMTTDALLELNPITQVKDYVLKAVNLEGTEAERLVAKIRKKKPEFAKLRIKEDDKKSKKGKKSKKKLSEDEEY